MRRLVDQFVIAIPSLFMLIGTFAVPGEGAQMPSGYHRSQKIPAGFLALTPEGYTVDSQQAVKYGQMATLSFAAKKQFEGRHSLYFSEYRFELNIKESTNQLVKMQGPMYQKQLDLDIEKKLSGCRASESDAITGYDQPQVVKYPWGAGITQRIVHKYMGAGKSPDEIEYTCGYYGLILDDHSIKRFTVSVSGVESPAAADAWAKKIAGKAALTSLGEIGDK